MLGSERLRVCVCGIHAFPSALEKRDGMNQMGQKERRRQTDERGKKSRYRLKRKSRERERE